MTQEFVSENNGVLTPSDISTADVAGLSTEISDLSSYFSISTIVGNQTLSAAQLKSGFVTINATQTAAFTLTTDTAANITAVIPTGDPNSFKCRILNNDTSLTYPATIAAGSGVTLGNTFPTIPAGSYLDILFVVNSSSAVTVYALAEAAPVNPANAAGYNWKGPFYQGSGTLSAPENNDITIGNGLIAVYSGPNKLFYGISMQFPSPAGSCTLGGYYSGLGVSGNTSDSGIPIFGVLPLGEIGNGIGSVAFTIYGNNAIETYNSTLDDGNGNMTLKGALSISESATLTGTTSGSVVYTMPEQGVSKRVDMYLNGYENTSGTAQTITFPTPFTNTPVFSSDSTVSTSGMTLSTTGLTLPANMTAALTGYLFIKGI